MGKILIVDDESAIRDILMMILSPHYEGQLIEATNGKDAISLIDRIDDLSVILCDYKMPEVTGSDVYQHLKNKKLNIPFGLVSTQRPEEFSEFKDFYKDNPLNASITKPFRPEAILEFVSQCLEGEYSSTPLYSRLSIEKFFKYGPVKIPAYIKLFDGKFIKIYNGEDDIDRNFFDKYVSKGIEFIYFEKEAYSKLVDVALSHINESLANSNATEMNVFDSIEDIHEFLKGIGVTEKTIRAVENIVESFVKVKDKSLEGMILKLENSGGYLLSHAHFCACIGGTILEKMSFYSQSNIEKLVFCSFFKDIAFDDKELATFYSLEDEVYKKLPLESRTAIKNHVFDSVDILSNIPYLGNDSMKAIIAHHELPGGKGFPRGLSLDQLGAFEALFNLAVHFSHHLIIRGARSESDIEAILDEFEKNYTVAHFKEPFKILSERISG